MAYTKGLDVSHWNSVHWLDWADDGYVFVWIKATEGTSWEDNKMEAHRSEAVDNGFYVGAYHYFRAQWNGAEQAQHFYNTVKDLEWDMPPVVDVERINNSGVLSQAAFAGRLRLFLNECEELFGQRPVIYTSKYAWQELCGSVSWATAYDLWVANYTSNLVPLIPNDWQGKGWKVWQYTSTPLDQNRFDGGLAEFLEWIGEEEDEPLPPSPELEARVAALEQKLREVKEVL